MTDAKNKSAGLLRVVVRLRPEEYDELFHHVRGIGSTMSAFFRESAVRAMVEAGAQCRGPQPEDAPSNRLA
jgi:hypothetical protein